MTTNEQRTIDNLYKLVSDLKQENQKFREDVNKQVEGLSNTVDKKHLPLNLETEVINTMTNSLRETFHKALTSSYSSPLTKYAENVVSKYQKDIESVFDTIVSDGIRTPEFKESVRVVFLNKLAKTVVSGIDGSIYKTVNLMKQDSVLEAG